MPLKQHIQLFPQENVTAEGSVIIKLQGTGNPPPGSGLVTVKVSKDGVVLAGYPKTVAATAVASPTGHANIYVYSDSIPVSGAAGTYTLKFEANDGAATATPVTFTVTLTNPP